MCFSHYCLLKYSSRKPKSLRETKKSYCTSCYYRVTTGARRICIKTVFVMVLSKSDSPASVCVFLKAIKDSDNLTSNVVIMFARVNSQSAQLVKKTGSYIWLCSES